VPNTIGGKRGRPNDVVALAGNRYIAVQEKNKKRRQIQKKGTAKQLGKGPKGGPKERGMDGANLTTRLKIGPHK